MTRRRKIPTAVRNEVRIRANYLCEYCHASEKWQYVQFTVDHVIPLGQGGTDELENLALACFHCNRRKSDKSAVLDSNTRQEISLFNPRLELWNEHFTWSTDGLRIIGLTSIGRATVESLQLNRTRVLNIRAADVAVGRHPPVEDSIHESVLNK